MRIVLKNPKNDQSTATWSPCSETIIQSLCDELRMKNSTHTTVLVEKVSTDTKGHRLLAGKEFKLDELNYLCQQLSKSTPFQRNIFYAVADAQHLTTGADLINLSLNTHCYSLVSDFSNVETMTEKLFLNENHVFGSAELEGFDAQDYFAKLMATTPMPSRYGYVYPNQNQPVTHYDGKVFPMYGSGAQFGCVKLTNDGTSAYMELPFLPSKLMKTLACLDDCDPSSVVFEVVYQAPKGVLAQLLSEAPDLATLNRFATSIQQMSTAEQEHLSNLVDFVGIETYEELDIIIATHHECELFPEAKSVYGYGQFIAEREGISQEHGLSQYIDFMRLGQDCSDGYRGAFTSKGYLIHHGINGDLIEILDNHLDMSEGVSPSSCETKYYMPLTVFSYQMENDEGVFTYIEDRVALNQDILLGQENILRARMARYFDDIDPDRGLMSRYGKMDSINGKVANCVLDFEKVGGRLVGVAILTVTGSMSPDESRTIQDFITGHLADEISEQFEHDELFVEGQVVHVSLWNDEKDWALKTADEVVKPYQAPYMGQCM